MWAPTLDSLSLLSMGAALLASLTGSIHCIGMCGPLRILSGSDWKSRTYYHLGRLVAYAAIGAIAGGIGAALPFWIWMPFLLLAYLFGYTKYWQRWKNILPKFFSRVRHPFFFGLSSGLLPCGWLYAWIAAAVASESVWNGSFLLFFLWLGSIPALELFSQAAQTIFQPIRQRYPKLVPLFFILLALAPIFFRGLPEGDGGAWQMICHGNFLAPKK